MAGGGARSFSFIVKERKKKMLNEMLKNFRRTMNSRQTTKTAVVIDPQRPRLLSSLYSVLFILTWALVGLAAFRNTLTW